MNSEEQNILHVIATGDADGLIKAQKEYGDSWKSRGGPGAFFTLARPWDRLEKIVEEYSYDIFEAIGSTVSSGNESFIDSIRDLRRYLLLVEHHMRCCTDVELPVQRHNKGSIVDVESPAIQADEATPTKLVHAEVGLGSTPDERAAAMARREKDWS